MGNTAAKTESENSSEFDTNEIAEFMGANEKKEVESPKNGLNVLDAEPVPAASGCSPDRYVADDTRYVEQLHGYRLKQYPMKTSTPAKWNIAFTYAKQADALNTNSATLSTRSKRIQREMAKLHELLPVGGDSSIFVCLDDNRPDVIKALITGPRDTPYANGVFIFDVFFPEQYPHKPPLVTFLTTGEGRVRFNPNLYANGYVCLSVINTWNGRPDEMWNPYLSLHKVLLAIQAFVFVKDPFFNEPGFGKMRGGDWGSKCSDKYNARVRHATLLHAMLNQMKQPCPCFKDIIARHFAIKRQEITDQANFWLAELRTREIAVDGAADDSDSEQEDAGAGVVLTGDAAVSSAKAKVSNNNEAHNKNAAAADKEKNGAKPVQKSGISKWFSSLGNLTNAVIPSGGISVEKMEHTIQQLLVELNKQAVPESSENSPTEVADQPSPSV